MSLSLNVLIQFVIIFAFVFIFGWNLLLLTEGYDDINEIIDSKTGEPRKMTKREKKAADKKREEAEKEQNDDMDERFNSYKG
jgi:hypothetical protein